MAGFTVHSDLTAADRRAYLEAATRWIPRPSNFWSSIVPRIVFSALVGFTIVWSLLEGGRRLAYLAALVGVAGGFLWYRLRARWRRSADRHDAADILMGPVTVEFSDEGIRQERGQTILVTRWPLLKAICIAPEHLFLRVDRAPGYAIPTGDLPSGMTAATAAAEIRRLAEANGAHLTREDGASSGARPGRAWHGTALRLYTFRSSDMAVEGVSDTAIGVAGLISIALWALLDWAAREPGSDFYPAGFVSLAWHVLTALLLTWIVARLCRPRLAPAAALWLIALLAPLLVLGIWASEHPVPERWTWPVLLATWALAAAYAYRALKAMTGRSQMRAVLPALLVGFLAMLAGDQVYVNASLWMVHDSKDTPAGAADSERVLFDQADRIDAAVETLSAPRGAERSVYMLGFAGVGEQQVFADEVGLASRVIGERYGSTARTLLLINDVRDIDSQPLATASGLERALRLMGERMNRDTDVLFLVLSSHGSADPSIAVSNGNLPLDDLNPEDLAAALKDSGIRWKVIIISACYAGGFIPALKDNGTIILTAAAADRTSFGCSDDRDLTYFGEAFFRDSLPHAASLRDAFEQAARSLAARERAEHVDASNPQAFFGTAIMPIIEALDRDRLRP